MNKLSKEKKQQLQAIGIGTLAVIVGLYLGVIKTQKESLNKLQKTTKDEKAKVELQATTLKRASSIQAQLETKQTELMAIESKMPTGDKYAMMLNTLISFSRPYKNLNIDEITEIPVKAAYIPKFPYQQAAFHVKGTGYYHDIGKFIADFENNFPYFRIENLDLQPVAKEGDDDEHLAYSFDVVTLVRPSGS